MGLRLSPCSRCVTEAQLSEQPKLIPTLAPDLWALSPLLCQTVPTSCVCQVRFFTPDVSGSLLCLVFPVG